MPSGGEWLTSLSVTSPWVTPYLILVPLLGQYTKGSSCKNVSSNLIFWDRIPPTSYLFRFCKNASLGRLQIHLFFLSQQRWGAPWSPRSRSESSWLTTMKICYGWKIRWTYAPSTQKAGKRMPHPTHTRGYLTLGGKVRLIFIISSHITTP